MGVDLTRLGSARDSEEFRVNSARIAQFAAALDDGCEAHRSGRSAPHIFHHIPVMQSMVEVLRGATSGFALAGEHDLHVERAIVPGMRLFTVSRLTGIRPTKAGTQLIIRSDITTHDGAKVSTQYSVCLVTSATVEKAVGEAAPERPEVARDGPGKPATVQISADQAFRYADAARDYSPYTLDKDAAAANGFPAPILHGMCTLGLASRAVVEDACKGDPARLVRLGARFSSPVLMVPGQALTTRVWSGPVKAGRCAVAFETTDKDGKPAITRGFAEVRA